MGPSRDRPHPTRRPDINGLSDLLDAARDESGVRFVMYATFDPTTRTTWGVELGGGHLSTVRRAVSVIAGHIPGYRPVGQVCSVDANEVLRAVFDEQQTVNVSIAEATRGMVPPLVAVVMERVIGVRFAAAIPVTCEGATVGTLVAFQGQDTFTDRTMTRLVRCAEELSARLCVDGQDDVTPSARRSPEMSHLTSREREVWGMVAQGDSNQTIARRLGLSVKSVDNVIGRLYLSLGLDSQDTRVNARVQASLLYHTGSLPPAAPLAPRAPGTDPAPVAEP